MATPPNMPTVKTRTTGFDILSVVDINFARDGQKIETKLVSDSNMPDPVAAKEAWKNLGFGSNFQVTKDEKTIEVEFCSPSGQISKRKEFVLQGMTLSFLMAQMSPEAYELLLGLNSQPDDGKEASIGASGSGAIEGWISLGLKRAQDLSDKMTPIVAHGRLHLKTAPQGQSDFAKPEFEFIVDMGNPLNTATPVNIQTLNPAS